MKANAIQFDRNSEKIFENLFSNGFRSESIFMNCTFLNETVQWLTRRTTHIHCTVHLFHDFGLFSTINWGNSTKTKNSSDFYSTAKYFTKYRMIAHKTMCYFLFNTIFALCYCIKYLMTSFTITFNRNVNILSHDIQYNGI